jgi:hypothetical protein
LAVVEVVAQTRDLVAKGEDAFGVRAQELLDVGSALALLRAECVDLDVVPVAVKLVALDLQRLEFLLGDLLGDGRPPLAPRTCYFVPP